MPVTADDLLTPSGQVKPGPTPGPSVTADDLLASPAEAPGLEPAGGPQRSGRSVVVPGGGRGLVREPATPPPPGNTLREVTPQEAFVRGAERSGIPQALAATAAAGVVAASAPVSVPASVLVGAQMAASALAGVGTLKGLRYLGGAAQPGRYENMIEVASDSLPILVGATLGKLAMTPAEEQVLLSTMTKEGRAAAKAAALEKVPTPPTEPKPAYFGLGAAEKVPKVPPTPEPSLAPIVGPPVAPAGQATVGPEFTRAIVAGETAANKVTAAKYQAARDLAAELDLSTPFPAGVQRKAADALVQLDASGLEPTQRDATRKVLESIRDFGGHIDEKTGEVIVKAGQPVGTPERLTYGQLDDWRRKLQEIAPSFEDAGQAKSYKEGVLGDILGDIKESMKTAARGTKVETLAAEADDYLVNQLRPLQDLSRKAIRGEHEPGALIDTLTSSRNEHAFARGMALADRSDPALAGKVRLLKFQRMADRATDASGNFRGKVFMKELDSMPKATREALLQGDDNPMRDFLRNYDTAKAALRSHTADMQAEAAKVADAARASHEAATAAYQAAVDKYNAEKAAYVAAKRAAANPQPSAELLSARRKLEAQRAYLKLPAQLALFVEGARQLANGHLSTGVFEMLFAPPMLGRLLQSREGVIAANRVLRFAAAGASPKFTSRAGMQLLSHLVGNELMRVVPHTKTKGEAPLVIR